MLSFLTPSSKRVCIQEVSKDLTQCSFQQVLKMATLTLATFDGGNRQDMEDGTLWPAGVNCSGLPFVVARSSKEEVLLELFLSTSILCPRAFLASKYLRQLLFTESEIQNNAKTLLNIKFIFLTLI